MALYSCDFCGKVFNSVGSKVCSECIQQLDAAYIQVRRFIYQHPEKAKFSSIVEETEVSEELLSYLIGQGRIVLNENNGASAIRCRACGRITGGGQFCDACRKKLVKENMLPEEREKKIKPLWGTDRNR